MFELGKQGIETEIQIRVIREEEFYASLLHRARTLES
jgi:hypothetical protein